SMQAPTPLKRLAWLASLGLLFVAVAAWLVADDPLAPTPPAPSFTQEPDVLLEDADILQFGEDGALRYSVRSNKAEWFRQSGDMALTAPELAVPDEQGVPWRVVAARGDVQGGEGGTSVQVDLAGKVVLRRDEGDAFVQVATEALKLHPGARRAATEQPVSITTERSRIEAGGLDADLARGALRLNGGVDAVDVGAPRPARSTKPREGRPG
ncbi:MAG: LPS export ABC transporter periplasmic protein LptC, partial [Gammaproteobacteria bacterium]|nr:LPS export ABC transporter periplasmic protein LptC [Gammaproteobacteria bacterium]